MSVIGIDIDGTLARYFSWEGGDKIDEPDSNFELVVIGLSDEGHTLCAWSTRADYVVDAWLKKHNLRQYFSYINCSPYPTESSKASFDFYIGDDAVQWPANPTTILRRISGHVGHNFDRDVDFSSHNPKPYFQGVGISNVDRFESEWKKAWTNFYSDNKIAFMTICSHAKPYSKSFIHTMIRKHLYTLDVLDKVDYIHISNAGIIPTYAEMEYPFNAYDWDGTLCTPAVKAYHIEAIKRRFMEWIDTYGSRYDRIVIYLRRGGNTFGAIESIIESIVTPPIMLFGADDSEEHNPKYVAMLDVDDCLTSRSNLNLLNLAFGGFI